MTGNVRDNCYPQISLLPKHPRLASTDFIRLLPIATSHIRISTYYPPTAISVGYARSWKRTRLKTLVNIQNF